MTNVSLCYRPAMVRPPELMPNPLPEPFQLRIVIWTVTDIIFGEGHEGDDVYPSVYVTVKLFQDDGVELEESTDTHSRIKDGKATRANFLLPISSSPHDLATGAVADGTHLMEGGEIFADVRACGLGTISG